MGNNYLDSNIKREIAHRESELNYIRDLLGNIAMNMDMKAEGESSVYIDTFLEIWRVAFNNKDAEKEFITGLVDVDKSAKKLEAIKKLVEFTALFTEVVDA